MPVPDQGAVRAGPPSVDWSDKRLAGLLRFSIAITVLNLLGHLWLGFEQAWLHPFVALGASYATELAIEVADARAQGRPCRFEGGLGRLVAFLLPAHISGLAVGMLLYANERFWVIAFAAAVAIASKHVVRVAMRDAGGRVKGRRHVLNPSNAGITATLLLFPWVGIAQPYQFTENVSGVLDVLLPLVVVATGTLLNRKFTGRLPLIAAWLGGFAAQALIRAAVHDVPVLPGLMPMTGFAFILFTFYMITDPGTAPIRRGGQILFGAAVAGFYALFMELHVVFGMFYALTLTAGIRGLWLWATQSPWLLAHARRTGTALGVASGERSAS